MKCSVYIVCSAVLSRSNLKLHQTLQVKNIFKQEKIMLQLMFNPGLTVDLNAGINLFQEIPTKDSSPTSFPGSLFSASLGRWKKDPGCGWSRDHPESR